MTRVEQQPIAWSAQDASGTVTVVLTKEGQTVCRGFIDRIDKGGRAAQVRDIACWGDGWMDARENGGVAVLGPAFAETERVYTIKWGGSLAAVAKRTGANLTELELLNPGHPIKLSAGTQVLLP